MSGEQKQKSPAEREKAAFFNPRSSGPQSLISNSRFFREATSQPAGVTSIPITVTTESNPANRSGSTVGGPMGIYNPLFPAARPPSHGKQVEKNPVGTP